MKLNTLNRLLISSLVWLLISFPVTAQTLPHNIDISTSANGIVSMPTNVNQAFRMFNRYTKVVAPNGKAIHIVIQNKISVEQAIRAREVLRMFLTSVPGSQFGNNKAAVANQMANNNAMLMLVNGTHVEGSEPDINAQPLYQNEIQVEGHSWYVNQDYNHRDATYEEILHMVHDKGIGVDGSVGTSPGALPAYQTLIRAATNNAVSNNFKIWPIGARTDPSWYNSLKAENSLTQEYLAAVIDSYYGLWGAWTGSNTLGMWGEYISKTRVEIPSEDPMGRNLIGKFFSQYLTYTARIDASFTGTFTLTYTPGLAYTNHSQYLLHARLTGSKNSNLTGNSRNNTLQGNAGNNILDGKEGVDTVVLQGDSSDYTITLITSGLMVKDKVVNRDGRDILKKIEFLKFKDKTVNADTTTEQVAKSNIIPILQLLLLE